MDPGWTAPALESTALRAPRRENALPKLLRSQLHLGNDGEKTRTGAT